jgi:transcriptional regulator with XRE-family HTH domain
MPHTKPHWTSGREKDFLYRISFDFVAQIEGVMDSDGTKPVDLARKLGVSKGRVSQILNNPGNITLKTAVEYARALGIKVALVAYDDDDASNDDGPVNPQIFTKCWERAGKPTDFLSLGTVATTDAVELDPKWRPYRVPFGKLDPEEAATIQRLDPHIWQQREDGDFQYAGTDADHL